MTEIVAEKGIAAIAFAFRDWYMDDIYLYRFEGNLIGFAIRSETVLDYQPTLRVAGNTNAFRDRFEAQGWTWVKSEKSQMRVSDRKLGPHAQLDFLGKSIPVYAHRERGLYEALIQEWLQQWYNHDGQQRSRMNCYDKAHARLLDKILTDAWVSGDIEYTQRVAFWSGMTLDMENAEAAALIAHCLEAGQLASGQFSKANIRAVLDSGDQ